jgi:N-acetylmuramoyl-L-alanine amidase
MKLLAAVAIATILAGQPSRAQLHSVTAVRHWSLTETTRIAIEVTGDFEYRTERLHNPERVYYDILNSRPRFDGKRLYKESLDDKLVTGIRVAETLPGVTRVVLDLTGPVEATTSQLINPYRLMIELRAGPKPAIPTPTPPATTAPPTTTTTTSPKLDSLPKPASKSLAKTEVADIPAVSKPSVKTDAGLPPADAVTKAAFKPPTRTEAPVAMAPDPPVKPAPKPPLKTAVSAPAVDPITKSTSKAPLKADAAPPPSAPVESTTTTPALAPLTAPPPKPDSLPKTELAKGESAKDSTAPEVSKAARHTTSGETSLVRALGLKIGRVVIDAGHGGHDQGTTGPKGLLEKDVVLDVAMRIGKLVEDRMGAEVIYTRTDDTFIPLEGRTALANDKKADLFLSIHANSSSIPRIAGVETYYLNLPDSRDKDAADVAARENASSQKSVFELQDLVKKITLNDKVEESREFAGRVQASLYAFSARNVPNSRNRGVKKAPFVVLIGAHMPSILAEIGFLTNPREEALLRKPEYRQKLAEAIFRGVQRYADGLSHFQVANAGEEE